jgi:Tfp pilus assembly protein PilF
VCRGSGSGIIYTTPRLREEGLESRRGMPEAEEDLGLRYLAVDAALHRGEIERACREAELLLMDAPNFAPAWDALATCRAEQGDLERAGDCYRKAMRLDRRSWRIRYNWGLALHRAGALRDACRWLREAARMGPEERVVFRMLGLCHSDLSQYDEALRCFRKALELPEGEVLDSELYVRIGIAEVQREDLEAAEAAFERACLLAPDHPDVYFHWAEALARRGDLDDARRLARRARALEPKSSRSTLLLYRLALEAGEREDAERWIGALQERPETERLALALRAELALETGDREGARHWSLETLRHEGAASDPAVDRGLAVLRQLTGTVTHCDGYRLLIEAICGESSYFRPYVVLAESEERAREIVGELQEALDDCPWEVAEVETFRQPGEALTGVYNVMLSRVMFQRESNGLVF